jgi:hypothetical protein
MRLCATVENVVSMMMMLVISGRHVHMANLYWNEIKT